MTGLEHAAMTVIIVALFGWLGLLEIRLAYQRGGGLSDAG